MDSETPNVNADMGTPVAPPPPVTPPQWPMFGYNAQHTSQSILLVGPQTTNLDWTATIVQNPSPWQMGNKAIAGDGTIYQGIIESNKFWVTAYNRDSSVKWQSPQVFSSTDSTLFGADIAVGLDGTVFTSHYALNSVDGTIKWSMPVQGRLTVGPDGTVYVANWSQLAAIDPLTGIVNWSLSASTCGVNCRFDTAAIAGPDGTVYITTFRPGFYLDTAYLYVVNPSDGSLRSQISVSTLGPSWHISMAPDGKIYRTHTDIRPSLSVGFIEVVNPQFSSVSYIYPTNVKWLNSSAIAIAVDGTIIATGSDNNNKNMVIALNPTTGTEKWRFIVSGANESFSGTPMSAPTIDAGGTIYIGSCMSGGQGTLYAIDAVGNLKWKSSVGCISTQVVINDNAELYASDILKNVDNSWHIRLLAFKDNLTPSSMDGRQTIGNIRAVVSRINNKGYKFVIGNSNIQNAQLQVYNLSGRLVFYTGWEGNEYTWNIQNNQDSRLANSVYLYVIVARRPDGTVLRSQVKKLIVLR